MLHVVGILRRPRESPRYDAMRRATNKKIFEEVLKLKSEWIKKRDGNVSFLDLDGPLRDDTVYASDGVHLNERGVERMGGRLREWIRARSTYTITLD